MERAEHWNTLCLGILTIASAAVGTAVFASGLADIELSNSIQSQLLPEIAKVVFATVAIGFYLALTVISGQIIFGDGVQDEAGDVHKRNRTRFVYRLFVVELIALVFLLATNVFGSQLTAVLAWVLGEC